VDVAVHPSHFMTQRIVPQPRTRRELLKLTPLAALGAMLYEPWRESILDKGLRFSDWASAGTFRTAHLAPTYSAADVVPFERFPYNYFDILEPEIDFDAWSLEVSGKVSRPGKYALAQLQGLPKITQNTRLVCVEGWDAIGSFGGARLSDFLDLAGADPSARYVSVMCADNYYESIDLATARHPQTLLCYEMYGKPLDRGHGAPLRLQIPTTLGYKQAKYLMTLSVVDELGAGKSYWGDQGYSWYGGI
jgi:DMSO/TMAO reductase YedYZ molybdopterin-dependent catalytic subunit